MWRETFILLMLTDQNPDETFSLLTLMEVSNSNQQLSAFLESGIYRFEDSNSVFVDPVRVLNQSYTRFRVSPFSYYSRVFESSDATQQSSNSRKRKRKTKEKNKPYILNERERAADRRHQEAKPFLLKAYESLQRATELLEVISNLRDGLGSSSSKPRVSSSYMVQHSFIELGQVWQAPLYEIRLKFRSRTERNEVKDYDSTQDCERVLPVFNNLIVNETSDDLEAEFMDTQYILPQRSSFYMSDLRQIHNLVPVRNDCGFNIIVIDPPWENGSAHQKLRYPTLPNKYFLSLPIKKLSHTEGAIVALWVTNREKLRCFVAEELFPAWGVTYVATFYWLKVKADGSLISDLDLFHHRPYESLILGQCHGEVVDSNNISRIKTVPDNQVIISVPGDYSRKPPIGGLLKEYIGGNNPTRCLELFAREMVSGWVSWGNEPLHFQESRYFYECREG